MSEQRRERAVCCRGCGPRVITWNVTALCESCTRVVALVPNPTQITETVWGPPLDVDAAIAPEPLGVVLRRVNLDG